MELPCTNRIISDQDLLHTYLTPQMKNYFFRKLPTESEEHVLLKIVETLKYLSICHHSAGDVPISKELDDIWHLWILQTKQYQELTENLPSKTFLHHSSNDYIEENSPATTEEEHLQRQISFLASYIANFGEFTENILHFWPVTLHIMHTFNQNLDEFHQFMKNLTNESIGNAA